MSSAFDWPVLIKLGLHDLRLTPEVFWGLTPAEFRILLGDQKTAAPLLRGGLDALMQSWPDHAEGHEEREQQHGL